MIEAPSFIVYQNKKKAMRGFILHLNNEMSISRIVNSDHFRRGSYKNAFA